MANSLLSMKYAATSHATRRTFLTIAAGLSCAPVRLLAEPGRDTIATRFAPPRGFSRREVPAESFSAWLRRFPLQPEAGRVLLHTGREKARQDLHVAVFDIDIGTRDLQQCADAVMRLRAEWLFATGRAREIAFNDSNGQPMRFSAWADGERPKVDGKRLVWRQGAVRDAGHASLRRYLDSVFAWAGTYSLARELVAKPASAIAGGDVVITGGFPGHAVLVADAVEGPDGSRRVLLAQSYMPAQSIHVLKNLAAPSVSPWYEIRDDAPVVTPEWVFPANSLKTWRA